jgi:hypothetical protein
MGTVYRAIDVWRRRQNGAVRYRCFEVLPSGRFCVQSADFFNFPVDKQRSDFSDRQFQELLIEQSPDERTATFSTLEEAIAHSFTKGLFVKSGKAKEE